MSAANKAARTLGPPLKAVEVLEVAAGEAVDVEVEVEAPEVEVEAPEDDVEALEDDVEVDVSISEPVPVVASPDSVEEEAPEVIDAGVEVTTVVPLQEEAVDVLRMVFTSQAGPAGTAWGDPPQLELL